MIEFAAGTIFGVLLFMTINVLYTLLQQKGGNDDDDDDSV